MPSQPLESPPPVPSATPLPLHRFILANGLKVYLREDHRAPLVSAQMWYHVGSSYEPAGHSGLSHALEHLIFEGSSKLAPGQYSALISRLGGEPNAFTHRDATVFPVTLPASRVEIALEVMADAMASARLGEAAFTREIEVIKAERRTRLDSTPYALAVERARLLAHGDSRYATPIIGHLQDLEQMSYANVRIWYQSWYHPNNASLVVVGAISAERLRILVDRHFAGLQANRLPDSETPTQSAALEQRSQTVAAPGMRPGVIMAFNTPSQVTARTAEEVLALRLLAVVLAVGASSRLYRCLVRGAKALAVKAEYEFLQRGDGLFMISAFSKGAAEEMVALIWGELEMLRQTPPGEQELERAKASLLSALVFEQDDIARQASTIGTYASSGLDPDLPGTELQAIGSLTGERLRQAAHEYFTRSRLTVTYMQDKERAHE
ncbi:putative zinc protease [Pseudomonas fluorescens]|uniref:M16 family metallopeptidase n=1 Tax=Pseudomonas fluorescens TaxID=294 RepID=UPI00125ADDE3|nr:pitrilysin family protein [Pseudomonas fluorescens]CAG8864434.1 putative zinc protease [Pseudomonas fluorescens]VVP72939.1 putative zinc protease [Pseudomonas fluorescens]